MLKALKYSLILYESISSLLAHINQRFIWKISWGNPKLITWDYGKDINLTLQDAIVSWEELRVLFGGQSYTKTTGTHKVYIHKTAEKVYAAGETFAFPTGDGTTINGVNNFPATAPTAYTWINLTSGTRGKNGTDPFADEAAEATRVRFFWTEEVTQDNVANEIVISPNTFPGTFPQHCRAPRGKLKNANQFGELLETVA